MSLSSYRGKVVILAFNDSECTTVCPLTTAALVDAKAMLGSAASQVQLLGIDANPKATSIEDVLSYSQVHGMLYQWRYLTGSLSQLQTVWKDYSVGVTVNQNQIDHEPAIFVINQQGRLAKLYLTQLAYSAVPQLGQLLANEVSSLLPSHPAVHSHLSYDQVATIGPAAPTTLPEAGGGYVSLGPGQPGEQNQARLYLFFATWDQEITSLGGQLDALNAYQSAAAGARLPGLTAIDEGSVEPSASALPNFLAGLTHPLSYPVGIDGSGQVADGYGVQGEPWFVLASPSGQPIWTWEVSTSGWLSTASLDRHVRAALASAAKAKRRRPRADEHPPAPQKRSRAKRRREELTCPRSTDCAARSGAPRPDRGGRPGRPAGGRVRQRGHGRRGGREAEHVGQPDGQLRQHARHDHARLPHRLRRAPRPRPPRRPAGSTRSRPRSSAWPTGRG